MTRTLKISPDVDEHGSTKITNIATLSYPAYPVPRFAPQDTGPPGPGWTTHPAADAPARAGAVRSETAPTWREPVEPGRSCWGLGVKGSHPRYHGKNWLLPRWQGLGRGTTGYHILLKNITLWATLKWSRMILATRTSLGFKWSRKTPVPMQEVSCQGSMLRYPQMALVLELLTMNPMGIMEIFAWTVGSPHPNTPPRLLLRGGTCRACSDWGSRQKWWTRIVHSLRCSKCSRPDRRDSGTRKRRGGWERQRHSEPLGTSNPQNPKIYIIYI